MASSGARLLVAAALLLPGAVSWPISDNNGVLGTANTADVSSSVTPPLHVQKPTRKLQGKFLHITDFHPDAFYKPHTSTDDGIACHRKSGDAGVFGAETTECDSPMTLVDATLTWIRDNLKDEVDFVIWTGDTARHDSDEKLPRNKSDVIHTNRLVSKKVIDTFSENGQLAIPIIPNFGNNDFLPHNIFYPGPNKWLQSYLDIWHRFIPEEQRHSFAFGGWFEVEVIPNKLSVFSLNTMYFFDRNAGVDGCAEPTEPGFKHLEWLSIQLQTLRERGMKAILMGHVPPARTSSKQNWDETCWQKYTLWLKQYRDVVTGSFFGHMNIDHFLLQDTHDIDLNLLGYSEQVASTRQSIDEEFTLDSKSDYLQELRESWKGLPNAVASEIEEDETFDDEAVKKGKGKKKKGKGKGKGKIGGKYAERYQLSLISPSIVPNFFPTIRVIEYNMTGLENSPVWVDKYEADESPSDDVAVSWDDEEEEEQIRLELKRDLKAEKKKKKGKKGKKPDSNLVVPSDPAKKDLPGPAYFPQPLTLTGYTQYFANLTHINGMSDKGSEPQEFKFEVEYSTFTDKVYKLRDLTVKSYLKLAYRIGKQEFRKPKKGKGKALEEEDYSQDESELDAVEEGVDVLEDSPENLEDSSDVSDQKKKGKKEKLNKVWREFLVRAFVSTMSDEEIKKLTE